MKRSSALRGRVVVITGAAWGIGEVAARAIAADGASLILIDSDSDALERVVAVPEQGRLLRFQSPRGDGLRVPQNGASLAGDPRH